MNNLGRRVHLPRVIIRDVDGASGFSSWDPNAEIRAYVASLDAEAMARTYLETDGLLVLPTLPFALVSAMVEEARALSPKVVRKVAPFVRRAGAIPHFVIAREAPTMRALHESEELRALFERVTGIPLAHRASTEAHASALYAYRGGDYMDWHYDECGCEPGDSFSTIIGLVDRSSARLEIETRRDREGVAPNRVSLHTTPGTFAFFCGTRAYHRVTKLLPGEERITFAFTYVRRGKKPSGIYDFRMKLGNTFIYFGIGHLFGRRLDGGLGEGPYRR